MWTWRDIATLTLAHVRACALSHRSRPGRRAHTHTSVENHLGMSRSDCVVDMATEEKKATTAWPRSPLCCHSSWINSLHLCVVMSTVRACSWGNCPLRLQIWMTAAAEQRWDETGTRVQTWRLIHFPPHSITPGRVMPQDLDASSHILYSPANDGMIFRAEH